jgi:hypothetical protein
MLRRRTSRQNQASICSVGETRNGSFDLKGIVPADRAHLHPKRLRYSLDGTVLSNAAGISGIPEDSHSRQPWCDLLEQIQPFPARTVFEQHKAGNIAARPG